MPIDISENVPASTFALIGMLCLIVWPLFRTREAMLLTQLAGIAGLVVHYALLGITTAATLNTLGAIQIAALMLFGARPGWRWIGYALAAAGVATWQGIPSALSIIGMGFVAIGRVQSDPKTMRLVVLAGGPFWLAHDLVIASPVALADALSLAAGLGALALERLRPDGTRASRALPTHAELQVSS